MQDIDRLAKLHRVDRPERIAIEVLDHLEHAWPLPFPRLCPGMFFAELGNSECVADLVYDWRREGEQVALGRSNPVERFSPLASGRAIASDILFLG